MTTNRLNELMELINVSAKRRQYRIKFALFMKLEEYFNEEQKREWINYLDNLKQECYGTHKGLSR